MARREFTILVAGCHYGRPGARKAKKSGYPCPKAWTIATIAPIPRSAQGALEGYREDRSNGKHQNLVARGGRGHLGGRGGSPALGCRCRYGGPAAGHGGRDGGGARIHGVGPPSPPAAGFFWAGRRQRRGRGQYQRR